MNNHNGRPMGMRKTVQLLVILTILAWATQVLFHQWGYGAVIIPSRQAFLNRAASETTTAVRTIEVRPEIVASTGTPVTIREVCRWNETDQAAMSPYADVVVSKSGTNVSVDQIKSALANAGVDLKTIKFSGAATCAIALSDAPQVREQALESIVSAKREANVETAVDATPTTRPVADAQSAEVPATTQPYTFDEKIVVTRAISKGQQLLKSDVTLERVPSDIMARSSDSPGDFVGWIAARDLKAGDELSDDNVKAPQAITAGQFMTVSVNVGVTAVETVATAMNDGVMGDTIKAKNEANGDIYTVQITGPNTAQQVTSSPGLSSTTPGAPGATPGNDHGVATTDNGAN